MAGSCDDRIQRDNDTCVSHTSQNGTPRHEHGGGATPMEQFAAAVCLTYEKK